ncbi:Crp/Fnr family transcriptional regulator [Nemorincola caseinilytica]|uniref:Crp/Fnr family transcriptional regulator n=1 Tax=Nemorincola caseinilytica TaxID=2054315 RepID=A0ABP8N660_9BACT
MTSFLEYLRSVIPVSARLEQELGRVTKRRSAGKGQYLLRVGERCNELCFVEKGLLRGYYMEGEREVTNWLALDGEFAASFYSFVARVPSVESIEALEPTEMLLLPYDELQRLYKDLPETERLGRVITENYYVKLEGRLLGLQFKTVRERYDQLLANNPMLVQRAPLGYIASYLGITQETLSRIRGQY